MIFRFENEMAAAIFALSVSVFVCHQLFEFDANWIPGNENNYHSIA